MIKISLETIDSELYERDRGNVLQPGCASFLKMMVHLARVAHGKHAHMVTFHAVFIDISWFFVGRQLMGFRVETFLVRSHKKTTFSCALFWNAHTFILASGNKV
jgi:hypothetical protein